MSNNSDMVKLLKLMESAKFTFAGTPDQKPGDQVRGTEKATTKGTDHPFKGRLVGEEATLEDVLSKKYQDFKEIQNKNSGNETKSDDEDSDDKDDSNDSDETLNSKKPMNEFHDDSISSNPIDTVTLDVPLLLRIMEYSREDAKTDMDLHDVTEKLIDLGRGGQTLSMKDYDKIVAKDSINEVGAEGSAIGSLAKQKSMAAAMKLGQNKSNQTKPTTPSTTSSTQSSTPTTTQAAGKQMMDPDEQDAIEKIKTNSGLKSQYDNLIKKAQTGI